MAKLAALKWWGGKQHLAKKIIDLMPRHLHYVEAYCGGMAVLLNKNPFDIRHQWGSVSSEQGISEVANDIDGELQNFWSVLQQEKTFQRFRRIMEAIPFSERAFDEAANYRERTGDDVIDAVHFFVRCRQSRTGEFRDFATLSKNRTRRRQNEQVSAWWNSIEGLENVRERLRRVVILNRPAAEVIQQQDGEKTLFYCDPCYLHYDEDGTPIRATIDNYKHEMTFEDHVALLKCLSKLEGMFMLSGYPSKLYERFRSSFGWNTHEFQIDNKAAGGKSKRKMTEIIWCNF